jgi:hypothetical protein
VSTSTLERIGRFLVSGILRSGLPIFGKDIAKGEEVFAKPVYEIFILRGRNFLSNSRIPILNFSHERNLPFRTPCSEQAAVMFI